MNRRLVAWSLWGLTTAAATGVCWAGVSVVTPSITTAHSPAIPDHEVHQELVAPPPPVKGRTSATTAVLPGIAVASPPAGPAAPAAPDNAPAPAVIGAPAPTGAPQVGAGVPSAPGAVAPSPPGGAVPPSPSPSVAYTPPPPAPVPASAPPPAFEGPPPPPASPPPAPSPAPPPPAPPPPAPRPPAPPPPPSGPVTKTFSTGGGTLTVECQGSTISLVSASPASGYTLTVRSSGPTSVSLDFSKQTQAWSVHVTCQNGQPVAFIDE